jgi:hypothetical protein
VLPKTDGLRSCHSILRRMVRPDTLHSMPRASNPWEGRSLPRSRAVYCRSPPPSRSSVSSRPTTSTTSCDSLSVALPYLRFRSFSYPSQLPRLPIRRHAPPGANVRALIRILTPTSAQLHPSSRTSRNPDHNTRQNPVLRPHREIGSAIT